MVKIAIDMMGGDDAPGIVLEAVDQAIKDFKRFRNHSIWG